MSTLQRDRTEPISIGSKHRPKRWPLLACLCVIAALVVTVVTLSVQFVMSNKEHQMQVATQSQQLEALGEQLEELQKQEKENSSKLEAQDETIRSQQSQLELQNKTISDLKTQVSIKKSLQAAAQQSLAATVAPSLPNVEGMTGKKLVALTFDDGPGPYTARLLDAMKQRGVRATFFVLGTRVSKYGSLIKRMDAEGHEVANHSQNHKNLKRLSATGVRDEMEACAVKIEKLIGHKPTLMRCPGGNYNSTVKAYAKSVGIPIIQWDVDTRDWESKNVKAIMATTFKSGYGGVKDGSIILLHDIHSTSVDAALLMMDRLAKEGYTFVTVSELLAARCGGAKPGQVYSSGYPS